MLTSLAVTSVNTSPVRRDIVLIKRCGECPFRVRVVFKPAAEKFIVMKCETRHGPLPPKVQHPISAEHYYSSILIFTIAAMRMLWLIILSIELIG
jgi:hypothetical protein